MNKITNLQFGATMIGIIAVVCAFTIAVFLRAGGPYFPIAFILFMAIMLLIGVVWEHKGCVLAFIIMHVCCTIFIFYFLEKEHCCDLVHQHFPSRIDIYRFCHMDYR
jgi:hypothetical protein